MKLTSSLCCASCICQLDGYIYERECNSISFIFVSSSANISKCRRYRHTAAVAGDDTSINVFVEEQSSGADMTYRPTCCAMVTGRAYTCNLSVSRLGLHDGAVVAATVRRNDRWKLLRQSVAARIRLKLILRDTNKKVAITQTSCIKHSLCNASKLNQKLQESNNSRQNTIIHTVGSNCVKVFKYI